MAIQSTFLLLLFFALRGKNINSINVLKVYEHFLASSQNIRNSELFKRLNIKTAKETDIVDTTEQSIQTEDIVHCGVSCSNQATCSGLQYDRETKVCRKMKKVGEIIPLQCSPLSLVASLRVLLRKQSYAIKNQLVASEAPF